MPGRLLAARDSLAIRESVDPEELGGWKLHTETTGLVDYAVDTGRGGP